MAIGKMEKALRKFRIEGVITTIPFHLKVLSNPFYLRGEVSTDYIERCILN